jgi:hypothetical protein
VSSCLEPHQESLSYFVRRKPNALPLPQVLVYGEALDLSPFMAEQAMDEGPATYTLSGVIVHLDQVGPAGCMLMHLCKARRMRTGVACCCAAAAVVVAVPASPAVAV